ncbi:hypothetical protein IFM89_026285 [Coptis chinensis]|uniref:DNA polymerase n=1 Tax=Coptis chinensis TaxID=261450 RepID=A0A835MAT0_9MAGN|nr:hypothetical protein IFM89_026285 [Coptis chinensis]
MAPKKKGRKKEAAKNPSLETDEHGMFEGMLVYFVENGVQSRRLQIWKEKLVLMGATVEDQISKSILLYQWLEESLKSGEKVSEGLYNLKTQMGGVDERGKSLKYFSSGQLKENQFDDDELPHVKKVRMFPETSQVACASQGDDNSSSAGDEAPNTGTGFCDSISSHDKSNPNNQNSLDNNEVLNAFKIYFTHFVDGVRNLQQCMAYNPPDLNSNLTEIFGKLVGIYRALGDDRRSFSYYKAIQVIEKLSFEIKSVDQVKCLPTIGKSMQDHVSSSRLPSLSIHEIVTTGKLSKLEHFETDEKVRTISLFGEVWGIGPATALKLYEKGHRTLDDLKSEDSLTSPQRVGLKYFEDIKERIPRDEVRLMEILLQKAGEDILPGVVIVCGGSYRRGKSTCGDLDIIITHPDGESHKGFLARYLKHLKDIMFLREDLIISTHSEEGAESVVDTYFGLCTYPGRELRRRIDLKVYPMSIFAFGLIHWTGNDVLNRRLRILAGSKGYRLDDTGLYLATQSSGGKRGSIASTSLSFKTEKEVFDFLGFPWFEPHERNL